LSVVAGSPTDASRKEQDEPKLAPPGRRAGLERDGGPAAGIQRAYGADKLARLTGLKDRHDPANVFHLNHNIHPGRQLPP
jgi:Berberine and berberine like